MPDAQRNLPHVRSATEVTIQTPVFVKHSERIR